MASEAKDHEHVARFLSLYAKLRDMSDDDPSDVEDLAKEDEGRCSRASFSKTLALVLESPAGEIPDRSQVALEYAAKARRRWD